MKRPGKICQEMPVLGNKNWAVSGDKQPLWMVTAFTAGLHHFSPCYECRSDGTHHFNAGETPGVILLLLSPTCSCGEKHRRFEGGLTEWSCLTAICPHFSGAMGFFCLIIHCEMNWVDLVKEYVKTYLYDFAARAWTWTRVWNRRRRGFELLQQQCRPS